jgi:hypothetical protein
MDISKQFSFTDFLAYLFPGIMSIFGLYSLLLLTPAQYLLNKVSLDITTGILFLVISYVMGVIFSGFSRNLVTLIEKLTKYKDVRKTMPFDDFRDEVIKAFQDIFGNTPESKSHWSRTHYYLCRSLVFEKMPTIGLRADRQSNLALFRRNLVLPIFIWFITGVAWSISLINSNFVEWGILLIVITVLAWFFSITTTIDRLHGGESRETREVLLGFLAGYKAKIFIGQRKD